MAENPVVTSVKKINTCINMNLNNNNINLQELINGNIEELSDGALTSIGDNAFRECTKLTSINLPACTSIHSYAFNSCKSLTSIKLANTSKICTLSNSDAFKVTPIANKAGYIYVPDELVEQYKKATNWSVYASQIKPLSAYTEEQKERCKNG